MKAARGEAEEKLGRKLTDDEWAEREKQLVSRVNRARVTSQNGRVRTVLRVARGGYGAMEVLEDVTKDFFVFLGIHPGYFACQVRIKHVECRARRWRPFLSAPYGTEGTRKTITSTHSSYHERTQRCMHHRSVRRSYCCD